MTRACLGQEMAGEAAAGLLMVAQLGPDGVVLSLFKPQYEAPREWVRKGRVQDERLEEVLEQTLAGLADAGIRVQEVIRLPLTKKAKNPEAMLVVRVPAR